MCQYDIVGMIGHILKDSMLAGKHIACVACLYYPPV